MEQELSLLTDFMKTDDAKLLERYRTTDPNTRSGAYEGTLILHELLMRMGNLSMAKKTQEALEEAEERLEREVAALNRFRDKRNVEAVRLWFPVAQRLSSRIFNLKQILEAQAAATYGTAVQEDPLE